MIRFTRALMVAMAAAVVGALIPGVAAASPPANDDFDTAVVVTSFPHLTYNLDTQDATSAPDDPTNCANDASVWFSVIPDQTGQLHVEIPYDSYGTVVSVYTGSRGALVPVSSGCPTEGQVLDVAAGTTYHVMVAACCGFGGFVDVQFELSTPVLNDDFAAATTVSALPFQATIDTLGLTREPGEPSSTCGSAGGGTAWFSYTAAASGSLTVGMPDSFYTATAVYTGTSLADLDQVACDAFSNGVVFAAQAGVTYYIQTGEYYPGEGRSRTFRLAVAPPPTAAFYYYPQEPSRFEDIYFNDTSSDPAGGEITAFAWDFGDGVTSTLRYPRHRYAVDGTYQVSLRVTTLDGRTASVVQPVEARTHDVEITAFAVPAQGRVGQSRPITVEVRNANYREVVTVELYRSVPGASDQFVRFGQLTQTVQARPNRTVAFPFAYTFTDEDLLVGKVTFKAVAVLAPGVRDALPADNTVIAPVTRVLPARLV